MRPSNQGVRANWKQLTLVIISVALMTRVMWTIWEKAQPGNFNKVESQPAIDITQPALPEQLFLVLALVGLVYLAMALVGRPVDE